VIVRELSRERWLVLAGIVAVTALAWLDLWRRAGAGMDMDMTMPEMTPWSPAELGVAIAMWAVMMIAMMLPSAAPMLLLFATLQRKRRAEGKPATPVTVFAAGYLLAWAGFSVLAAGLQGLLQRAMLLSEALATTNAVLGGVILVVAGVYQITPLKNACLTRCQSPLGFLLTSWRDGGVGALVMGLRHGAYCVGCCWALMALLFVGGVMNLVWVAVLSVFVLAEKALARGPWLSRLSGAALIAWGVWVAVKGPTGP
jgi:predicted metal-binding membrane protein